MAKRSMDKTVCVYCTTDVLHIKGATKNVLYVQEEYVRSCSSGVCVVQECVGAVQECMSVV